jgi:uncharacterized OB-fold protein
MNGTDTETMGVRSIDPDLYRFIGGSTGSAVMLVSRSAVTGSIFWPRRLRCPESGGSVVDVELPGVGTLWSWTFVFSAWPGEVAPCPTLGYGVGLVDLDRGPRVAAILIGAERSWCIGDRMRACPLPMQVEGEGSPSLLAFETVRS